jgi:NAD(P)-dependent dehydrogenase (short-subunit alcohol dehydrogenase family)
MARDRIAVIAGAGPGTGRALGNVFAQDCSDVVLIARDSVRLEQMALELATGECRVHALPTDLTDAAGCESAARQIGDTYGAVDVLVHNAFHRGETGSLGERTAEQWYRAVDGNILAATNMMYGLRKALAQRQGAVVLMSSISARQPYPQSGMYGAMKAALLTLVQVFAREFGADGVRVNAVVPGYIESPHLDCHFADVAARAGITLEEARMHATEVTCLQRFVTPREVAMAARFLSSAQASGITGQSLDVNAGQWFG